MPTIIGHSAAAIAISGAVNKKFSLKILLLSLICSFIPDADFISFVHNIEYNSLFGHRGFSHSILFAIFLGFIITFGFFPKLKVKSKEFFTLFLTFFLVTISHSFLDMLANGGYGVALFSPFSNTRFFFPWQPIPVSLVGINHLTDHRTIYAVIFEILFLLLPSLLLVLVLQFSRKGKSLKNKATQ